MQQLSLDEVRDALNCIPSDERDLWVRMGMAVRSHLGDSGRDIWMAWSATSERFDERAAKATWRSFAGGGRVGIGSLVYEARRRGWQGARRIVDRSEAVRERERARRQREREAAEADRRAEEASRLATEMIHLAKFEPHPYLASRGFQDTSGPWGGRTLGKGLVLEGDLLLPMIDYATRKVMAVQVISPEGAKKFLPYGCRVSGCVYWIGAHKPEAIWFCEGYATGLSVFEAVKSLYRERDAVVVCFSAHNLAKYARGYHRRAYVVADHDLPDRTGKSAGQDAAARSGRPWWMPPNPGTDANDFYREFGERELAAKLRPLLAR